MEHNKVVERHCYADFSLNRGEQNDLINAMEAYCQKVYHKTCTAYINEIRQKSDMELLPENLSGLFPNVLFPVTYQEQVVSLDRNQIFLNGEGQLCCQLANEDFVRPLRDDIRDIKEGDAFFYGEYGFIHTTSNHAHQNTDEHDHPWIVYGNDAASYFEEDIGHNIGAQIKTLLQEWAPGSPGRPSFDHLVWSAATRAADAASQNTERAQVSPSLQSRG